MREPRALICLGAVVGVAWHATPVARAQPSLALKAEERPHFRSAVKLTTVTATVADADGRLVRDVPHHGRDLHG